MGTGDVVFLILMGLVFMVTMGVIFVTINTLFVMTNKGNGIVIIVLLVLSVVWNVQNVGEEKQRIEVREHMIQQVQELTGEADTDIYSSDGVGNYRVKSGKSIYDVQVKKGEVDTILHGNGILYEKEK